MSVNFDQCMAFQRVQALGDQASLYTLQVICVAGRNSEVFGTSCHRLVRYAHNLVVDHH